MCPLIIGITTQIVLLLNYLVVHLLKFVFNVYNTNTACHGCSLGLETLTSRSRHHTTRLQPHCLLWRAAVFHSLQHVPSAKNYSWNSDVFGGKCDDRWSNFWRREHDVNQGKTSHTVAWNEQSHVCFVIPSSKFDVWSTDTSIDVKRNNFWPVWQTTR